MFDSKDNTKQMTLLGYITSKNNYSFLATKDLVSIVKELRKLDDLSEGIPLDYIEYKIEQSIDLDLEEHNFILSTLSLHGEEVFFDEKFELVRVQK